MNLDGLFYAKRGIRTSGAPGGHLGYKGCWLVGSMKEGRGRGGARGRGGSLGLRGVGFSLRASLSG